MAPALMLGRSYLAVTGRLSGHMHCSSIRYIIIALDALL